VIEERLAKTFRRFEPGPVPRLPHRGGYRVLPHTFEFSPRQPSMSSRKSSVKAK
jgi:pyridoxine/pyridoxamine 5'-phosphate oxidase